MFLPVVRTSLCGVKRIIQKSRAGISLTVRALGVKPTQLKMPALSPTMTEGTIIKWLKKEGDAVVPGDALCEIQTDKAVMTFEIEEPGILAKILVFPTSFSTTKSFGSNSEDVAQLFYEMPDDSKDVKVGRLIALVVEEGEDWKDVEMPTETVAAKAEKAPSVAAEAPPAAPKRPSASVIGPAVRNVLDTYGLDGSTLSASGPHGILLKGYVEQHKLKPGAPVSEIAASKVLTEVPHSAAAPVELEDSQPYTDIPLTSMRITIAKRLTESKWETPHAYAAVETCMNPVIQLRKSLQTDGIKVSLNDFIIKAVAVALHRVPQVNAQWVNEDIKLIPTIDISVAVATESGLITPIVKDAIGLGVSEISRTVKELADRAKKGKLKPAEFMGGTFTISNLGMFGISEFTAIINPPQSAILAVGTSRTILDKDGWRSVMTSQMSYDARVMTTEIAAIFLEEFSKALENPGILLGPVDLATFPVHKQMRMV